MNILSRTVRTRGEAFSWDSDPFVPETRELVEQLSNSNRWWRLTAQRLLLERQDSSAVPLLRDSAIQGNKPQARLHAFYALEGLSASNQPV